MEPGTLLSHIDTDLVTREQLALVETPDATRSFKPVPHIAVVNALVFLVWVHGAREALDALGLQGLRFGPRWSIGWFFVPFAKSFSA